MYNAELEGRQKLWRWLILAVIGILIFETWLAGRTIDRPRSTSRGGFDDMMSTELRRALEQVAGASGTRGSGLGSPFAGSSGPWPAYAFGWSARTPARS